MSPVKHTIIDANLIPLFHRPDRTIIIKLRPGPDWATKTKKTLLKWTDLL